jgi:hypothetical protein
MNQMPDHPYRRGSTLGNADGVPQLRSAATSSSTAAVDSLITSAFESMTSAASDSPGSACSTSTSSCCSRRCPSRNSDNWRTLPATSGTSRTGARSVAGASLVSCRALTANIGYDRVSFFFTDRRQRIAQLDASLFTEIDQHLAVETKVPGKGKDTYLQNLTPLADGACSGIRFRDSVSTEPHKTGRALRTINSVEINDRIRCRLSTCFRRKPVTARTMTLDHLKLPDLII